VVRRRLDTELVRRRLAVSRQQARSLVEEGAVLVAGAVADKPGRLVDTGEPLELRRPRRRFVSRGGEKLEAALRRFEIATAGRHALDAGASTGGFTDCLLHRGVARVVAVDVGYGQLAPSLRADPRVTVVERTNIRHLEPQAVGGPFELVVADLSFISLATLAPVLAGSLAAPGADLVLLVKPQFEAGRQAVSRGRGVVHDPLVRAQALRRVSSALHDAGATIMGVMASPLLGPAGNVEFLLHVRAHAGGGPGPAELSALVDKALAESPGRNDPPGCHSPHGD